MAMWWKVWIEVEGYGGGYVIEPRGEAMGGGYRVMENMDPEVAMGGWPEVREVAVGGG